jgi:hypothetical protein
VRRKTTVWKFAGCELEHLNEAPSQVIQTKKTHLPARKSLLYASITHCLALIYSAGIRLDSLNG